MQNENSADTSAQLPPFSRRQSGVNGQLISEVSLKSPIKHFSAAPHRGQKMADDTKQAHLTQRLYTTAAKATNPHFLFDFAPLSVQKSLPLPRLSSAPASLYARNINIGLTDSAGTHTVPSPNTAPTGSISGPLSSADGLTRPNTPHLIANAAEHELKSSGFNQKPPHFTSGSTTPRVVLRAKKPVILPISSTPGHIPKQGHSTTTSRPSSQQTSRPESAAISVKTIDIDAINQIIRPKRFWEDTDELDKLGLGHARNSFSGSNLPIIPPISSASSRSSSSDAVPIVLDAKSGEPKRVRLIIPDSNDIPVELFQNFGVLSVATENAKPNEENTVSNFRKARKKPLPYQLGSEEVTPSALRLAKTPFDFIRYIGTKCSQSKDFAYLNAIKPSIRGGNSTFNPYNLVIVEYKDITKADGYFTISSKGITSFNVLGHGEFTPTAQWLREHDLFHKLLKIPFFARYRFWKCFTVWHRSVLHAKISKSKIMLSQTLFLGHPVLRPALLRVRGICVSFADSKKLFLADPETTYELSDFLKSQLDWVQAVSQNALKDCETQIRLIVLEAATRCLNNRGFDTTLKVVDENEQENALNGVYDGPRLTFTQQSARRAECLRLQRFVKVVDYMVVNMLHMLVIESVQNLLRRVFCGCENSDVVVDGYDGDDPIRDEQIGLLMELERPQTFATIVNSSIESSRLKSELSSSDNISNQNERLGAAMPAAGTVQVGGAIVGPEVETTELSTCGFDGFVSILSRILRAAIPRIEIKDAYDKEEFMDVENESVNQVTSTKSSESPRKDSATSLRSQAKLISKESPLFKIQLLLFHTCVTKHLYFQPSLPDFLNAIDELLKSYVLAVQEYSLIANTIPFLDPSKLRGGAYSTMRGLDEVEYGEGPQVMDIITEGGYFREICGRIRGVLVGLFLNAAEWMLKFDEVRNMWIENELFNAMEQLKIVGGPIAAILASNISGDDISALQNQLLEYEKQRVALKMEQGIDDTDQETKEIHVEEKRGILEIAATVELKEDGNYSALVEFFQLSLEKFEEQRQTMNSILSSSIINNLNIDTSVLKSVLVPSPERCFSEVASILPGLARDKNELLLTELQNWVRILNTQSNTVEGYVEYLGWLDKISRLLTQKLEVKSAIPLVEAMHEEVFKLYTILDLYKIPIQPTDLALFQTLTPTVRTLHECTDIASDTKEENINKFSAELEKLTADLMGEVSEVRNKAQDPIVLNLSSNSDTAISFLGGLKTKLEEIEAKKRKYEAWADLFKNGGSPLKSESPNDIKKKSAGGELEDTFTDVQLKNTLWTSLKEWSSLAFDWKTQLFDTLDIENVNAQIQSFTKTVYLLDKGLPPNDVVPKLKSMVDEYRIMYPTIMDLRNQALKARHWEKIQDALGKPIVKDETFTLGKLVELRAFDLKEEISSISSQAASEAALEEMLLKVVKNWNETEFVVVNYRDSKDVFILGTVEDIQTLLEDSQVTIATIKSSRFIGPIKHEVEKWDRQLALFSETLDAWLNCQRNWLYLESIFSAPDIQRQLPDEARMFAQVDRNWKEIMRRVSRNPNAIKSGTVSGLLETLQQNNTLLDQIQKCLEDYLESKRLLFPRFYFLSNDELLEILSQTRNPQAVQPHLSKCFDAIKSLDFASSEVKSTEILAMISPEGERVAFTKIIKARGNVEAWLGSVEEGMFAILRRLVKIAISEYESSKRADWVKEHAGQVVVTGNQIIWTRDVSEAIKSSNPEKALNTFKQESINNLSALAGLVRGELTSIQRAVLGALITIDVHNRDIVQGLCLAKVSRLADFEWTKQLRYYW
ncbi:Dynein heavy chain 6, axonemal [Physocladia obscura]|uniref:Dynein heavy chain 6, axonemal n=1 Tax=Physocladia obscura TaxID=109957 RepID=A0AAD5T3G7_9FUNG|nr:Dynein heavy chain 6, axonemal [Physocladia obscura]